MRKISPEKKFMLSVAIVLLCIAVLPDIISPNYLAKQIVADTVERAAAMVVQSFKGTFVFGLGAGAIVVFLLEVRRRAQERYAKKGNSRKMAVGSEG